MIASARRFAFAGLVVAACTWLGCAASRSDYPKLFFQKGVNFTAEWPDGYSPESCARMLDLLHGYGVNAVALVPYGVCRRNDIAIRFNFGMERAHRIDAVAKLAHERGMKVMLKPQIWVRDADFPGDIDIRSPRDRKQWFLSYGKFVEFYAGLAEKTHADIFCVGVEFVKMSHHEFEWRRLIERVRRVYRGPLVYAATQGPEFEGIRFWDALDYIGLDEYYPLPDNLSTDELVKKVETVQRRYHKPVIFTEAGFPSLKSPQRAPWDESPREVSLDDQKKCYEAIFHAFYRRPWFEGMYWWKVGTNGRGGPDDGSYTPWNKPAMEVIGKWYRHGGR